MKLQAIIVILFYFFLLYFSKQKKLKSNIFLINGPFIFLKSPNLLRIVHKISSKNNIWKIFSFFGILFLYMGMFFMIWMILNVDYLMILNIYSKIIPKITIFNKFHNIILIPGVNDIIPFSWGLISLIITLIIHELSHSIVCFNEKINVNSIGFLFLIIPIGGFAEPDEKELYKEKYNDKISLNEIYELRKKRLRILSSGVMGNFFLSIIALSIFFGPVLNMFIEDNDWVITSSNKDENNTLFILSINNINIKTISDIYSLQNIFLKSKNIKLTVEDNYHIKKNKEIINIDPNLFKINSYIIIENIEKQSPAYYSNLKIGDIILEIDNYQIKNTYDFSDIINSKNPLDNISMKILSNNKEKYEILNIGYHNYEKEKVYIGITYSIHHYIQYSNIYKIEQKSINNNLKSIPKMLLGYNNQDFDLKTINQGMVLLTSLPLIINPPNLSLNIKEIFNEKILINNLKLILLNSTLWIGWMNLYIGLFNCLPAYPLDGGIAFKTSMEILFQKIGIKKDKINSLSNNFLSFTTCFIYISILSSLIWPYLCSYLLI